MLGKLVPYLCIGMTMAVILFLIMRFLFGVPIAGSVVAMMFATLVYVFALLSLGCWSPPRPRTRCRRSKCR